MTLSVFCIVLFAALLHASWNAVVKVGSDKLLSMALVTMASAVLSAALLPFLPQPEAASWPYIAASAALQLVYSRLIAAAYHAADMGVCYPIMRGLAPLLVAGASVLHLGDGLSGTAWLGVLVICGGILAMTAGLAPDSRKGALLAACNAVMIAGYTLTDGIGVRLSGAAMAYTLWIFLITGILFSAWTVLGRRDAYLATVRGNWQRGLVGGAGSAGSYCIVLWAMTRAPIAVIAALRETSILFGALIAVLWLHERISRRSVFAIAAVVTGAMLLRLG